MTTQQQGSRKKKLPPTGNRGDVMVVGGGVSGIQASLDLANTGFRVFLVEESPILGGKMAQLDKTFPTNDCSMCILSPKFVECDRHPNIEILAYTEVDKVEGEAGNFTVTLRRKARFIDEELCIGCRECHHYCPVKINDDFNVGLATHKSLYIPFGQSVPNISTIDEATCLFFQDKCKSCVPICKHNAINLYMKEEKIEVKVGAIVLAPGYQPFDPKLRTDYGYGKMANVVTSLEFERIICASGPFGGEMIRPSDKKHPKKIAWIQCVGSRQVTPGGNSYCSAVCCMYTTKQVILAKDHDSNVAATVFHNDIRAYGKDFERYYNRAAAMPGVRYIRSYVSIGREIPGSKNVTIKYSADGTGVKEEEFDLVVLSVGLAASPSAEKLANKLSIELNQHRFCNIGGLSPMETNRPGIYVSGAFQGPMDIPESVMTASGAAALCGQLLAERRGKLAQERVYPAERDVSAEELRIGVFACRCGTNIGSVVDVPSLVEYAKTLGNVVYVQEDLYTCSSDTAQKISETIREKGLNRVIVSACTPRTHEPIFQDTLREGGINKYLFVMANIREHSSWVHAREKDKATQKAKDITRMAVARAISQRPLEEFEVPVNKRGLVVGGGVAGMVSALSLADQGFEVYLVEKEANLGGIARRIHFTLDGMDVDAYLDNLIQRVKQHPLIKVATKATIIGSSGFVGNFITKVMSEDKVEEIEHGTIIIATGSQEYKPTEYLYGKNERVVTLLELEELIAKGDTKILDAQSLVIIQCVGCRQEDRPYCSRVCCGQAVKCALKLKEKKPQMDIYILYRDMRTYGFKEDYYREASNQGVNFILYEADDKPQVEVVEVNGKPTLRVTVTDPILGQKVALNSDILALAAAIIPTAENNKEISQLFKVPLNQDGFFLEAHVKLRPVDFTVDGIFLCGIAHYPKYISETISQAYAAAGRAATVLSKDTMISSGAVCEVDESECIGCGICESVCPFKAITMQDSAEGLKANVIPVVCKACGICNVRCPTGAISLKHFTDEQIFTQIDAAFAVPVAKELQPV